jgi:hypothetical protein
VILIYLYNKRVCPAKKKSLNNFLSEKREEGVKKRGMVGRAGRSSGKHI